MDNCLINLYIDNLNSPAAGEKFWISCICWPVGQLTKVVWLTAFLDKKKTFLYDIYVGHQLANQ